ncbi:hypothetical protein O3P69_020066 [Scylla paramamosain]|uniref:Uncharacterized protein n=1 Tax=Scylla paramamosain TaxID=85552 RepID=A0AAW0TJJ9_SCYPA
MRDAVLNLKMLDIERHKELFAHIIIFTPERRWECEGRETEASHQSFAQLAGSTVGLQTISTLTEPFLPVRLVLCWRVIEDNHYNNIGTSSAHLLYW